MSYKARALLPLFCLSLMTGFSLPAGAVAPTGTLHVAETKRIKSINADVPTEIRFANKSGKPVNIYWLDYKGVRKRYQTLLEGKFYVQQTFLTHPWVVTDEHDNAWYVYFPDAQPRAIDIVTPKSVKKN